MTLAATFSTFQQELAREAERAYDAVLQHIYEMEDGMWGDFFAPEGGPSSVNDVRAKTITEDYLEANGWHLEEEWAADLEQFIYDNHESYDLTWWDEEEAGEKPHDVRPTPFGGSLFCYMCNSPLCGKA